MQLSSYAMFGTTREYRTQEIPECECFSFRANFSLVERVMSYCILSFVPCALRHVPCALCHIANFARIAPAYFDTLTVTIHTAQTCAKALRVFHDL